MPQRADPRQVGTAAINGSQVQLEVAGVENHALIGVESSDVARRD